jgi:competence protein ComEC
MLFFLFNRFKYYALFIAVALHILILITVTSPQPKEDGAVIPIITPTASFLHQRIIDINRQLIPQPYADVLTSFVFGDNGIELPPQWKDTFKRVGLTHLLVVSGAQVSLLDSSVLIFIKCLGIGMRLELLSISLVNVIFYFVTGGGASILRAVLMAQCGFLACYVGRRLSIWHKLAASAWLMMICDPGVIWDIGAQLSFLATVSLVGAVPIIEGLFSKKIPSWITTTVCISFCPFLITTPLLWFYFQQISPMALVSNALLLWLAEITVVCGFFSCLLGLVYQPFAYISHNFCLGILFVIEKTSGLLAAIPWASFSWPSLSVFGVIMLYVCLIYGFITLKKRRFSGVFISGIGTVCIVIVTIWPAYATDNYLKVLFIDVGQGDSILIQTPQKHTILIDTGNRTPFFDAGAQAVLPALQKYGINRLDILVLTHADWDHIGGCVSVVPKMPIKMLIDSGEPIHKLSRLFKDKRLEYHQAHAGDRLNLGENIGFEILHPDNDTTSSDSPNNQSVVIKLTYKSVSFLLTGDLEEEKERHLIGLFNLKSTVLKLGHHGSKTSTTQAFLEAVSPLYVIVSAGRKNLYHHPHPSVVSRVLAFGCKIFRTDQDGSILFLTDGTKLWIKTFKKTAGRALKAA